MKKKNLFVTGLCLLFIFSTGLTSGPVFAANESGKYLKDARFLVAVDAKTDTGKEMVIAMYDKKDKDILYVNDSKNHAYAEYFLDEGYSSDVGKYQDIYVNNEPLFRFFNEGKKTYLIFDNDIYTCEHLDSYEMSQIMSYD